MPLTSVDFIVVHCSATGPKRDPDVAEIDRWHRARGFVKVGYHFVIRRAGLIEAGRPLTERGAHAEGFNDRSVAICLAGGTDGTAAQRPQANFTELQLAALRALLDTLQAKYPQAQVLGHRDLPGVKKACPSFDVRHWLATGEVKA